MIEDEIEIRRLEVECHIGVLDEERANPQNLWISARMIPSQGFTGLHDDVKNTVDYYDVSLKISELAASKPRHLIETLANEIAEMLLTCYPLKSVTLEVEKRILTNAQYVAVKVHREVR